VAEEEQRASSADLDHGVAEVLVVVDDVLERRHETTNDPRTPVPDVVECVDVVAGVHESGRDVLVAA